MTTQNTTDSEQQGRPSVEDSGDVIIIYPSPTADTRSCDWSKVSIGQLCDSSIQHRSDVVKGFEFFIRMMKRQAALHDHDKLSDIDGFHHDFQTGFAQTTWWDKHRKINRHHLLQEDGVPDDVNLVDVLDLIVDCTVAGMARTGEVYPLTIPDDVLRRAFDNTCRLLHGHIRIEPSPAAASSPSPVSQPDTCLDSLLQPQIHAAADGEEPALVKCGVYDCNHYQHCLYYCVEHHKIICTPFTSAEADLIVGAIPLQVLPVPARTDRCDHGVLWSMECLNCGPLEHIAAPLQPEGEQE